MTAAAPAGPREEAGLEALAALVRGCAAAGVERRVMLLRAEMLPETLARPHHLRLACAALDPLMGAERAQWHSLPGRRIAVSWRGEASRAVDAAWSALAHLLEDAPPGTPAPAALAPVHELPRDGDALLRILGAAPPPPEPPPSASLPPLDAAALAAMEAQLTGADVSRFARRKMVCERVGGRLALAWDKRHLSIGELGATLAPGHAVQADPWLFRRLTRTLDRRMLALLASAGELRGAGPFSLNLNVASLLSPEFLRFDAALPAPLRGRVVLDLDLSDILADPAAFAFARDFARTRSYRLLLRGVDAALLPVLALDRMELDLVQLRWSAELARLGPAELPVAPGRLVLGRADAAEALAWGDACGITLFQGRAALPTAA